METAESIGTLGEERIRRDYIQKSALVGQFGHVEVVRYSKLTHIRLMKVPRRIEPSIAELSNSDTCAVSEVSEGVGKTLRDAAGEAIAAPEAVAVLVCRTFL